MRQRSHDSGGAQPDRVAQLLEEDALDVAEQRELVTVLERTHASQSRAWRLAFGALGAALALLLLWSASRQAARPWLAYRHHSAFHRTLPAAGVSAAEAISGLTLLLGAAALLSRGVRGGAAHRKESPRGAAFEAGAAAQRSHRGATVGPAPLLELWLAGGALAGATVMAVVWGAALFVSFSHQRVDSHQALRLLWLPLAPLGYALLVWVVLRMARGTEAELRVLRSQMYSFQKA